jgi:hypothetical protein
VLNPRGGGPVAAGAGATVTLTLRSPLVGLVTTEDRYTVPACLLL